MSFSPEQVTELKKGLPQAHVKTRKQSGVTLSYIEGWKAIEEANRIFGFDCWMRETLEIRQVAEGQRKIGNPPRDGFGVSYIAKARITAFAGDCQVIREGVGAGHGIDIDLGKAHESAIKEAETDAMKRALMTFGWPFGLALYDKNQEHVDCDKKSDNDASGLSNIAIDMIAKLDEEATIVGLNEAGQKISEAVTRLPKSEQDIVRGHFKARKKALTQAETLAA